MQSNSTDRKDQTQVGLGLPQPFRAHDLSLATGLTRNGAGSQFLRWENKGWIEKVPGAFGYYKRTPQFGEKTPRGLVAARIKAAPDPKAAKRAYQAKWRADRKKKIAALLNSNNSNASSGTHVVPCQLDYCPNCKTRFYMAKGE